MSSAAVNDIKNASSAFLMNAHGNLKGAKIFKAARGSIRDRVSCLFFLHS